jgi:hypothetical protein
VYQVLQLNPSLVGNPEEHFVAKFQGMHTEAEWATLLQRLLRHLSRCFIVIETHDLFQANQGDDYWTLRFLQTLYGLADPAKGYGNTVKILILCYQTTFTDVVELKAPRGTHYISTMLRKPVITPVCRKHTVLHQKNAKGWRRCTPKI